MGRALRLATMGVPVGGGGASTLSKTFAAGAIVPTFGANLLTNSDFSAWTGDNPDGWTIIGESDSDPMVTEVGSGGGAGNGLARLYSSVTNARPILRQSVLSPATWYKVAITIDTVTQGAVSTQDDNAGLLAVHDTSGAKQYVYLTHLTAATHFDIRGRTAPTDVVIDDVSVQELVLSSAMESVGDWPGKAGIYTCTPTVAAGTEAGFVFAYADANNYGLAVVNRHIGAATLFKCVSGTLTRPAQDSITYGAEKELKVVIDNAGMAALYYDDNLCASAADFSDAGLGTEVYGFSTDSSNAVGQVTVKPLAAGGLTLSVDSITVFDADEVAYDWYGRPTVEIVNGVVVMAYYASTEGEAGNGVLHIRFSDDYGATWTMPNTTLEGRAVSGFPMSPPTTDYPDEDFPEVWLTTAPNGDLVLTARRQVQGQINNGSFVSISSDGGESWSEPVEIDFGGITGAGDDAEMRFVDDSFVYDGVIYAGGRDQDDENESYLFKSTDNGVSWSLVGVIAAGTSEVGLEYLGNNRIVALLRDRNTDPATGTTYLSFSDDMGITWGSKQSIRAQINRSGRHRILTKKHLEGEANWWEDQNLIACGFVTGSARGNALFFSRNGGQTWIEPQYVDILYSDGGYGDVFYNPNTGQYVFMCYRGNFTAASLVQYNVTVTWN